MKKLIGYSLISLVFISCGPTAKEKEVMEKARLDSLAADKELIINQSEKIKEPENNYYLASEFGLISGKIVKFEPTDETIGEMRCAGGENLDEQIYIQIADENGKITVLPCDYKTWLNLPNGGVLK